MLDLGWTELLLIGIVALIVVGPKDLPGMFQAVGKFVGKARGMAREFSRAMNDAADQSGVNDIQKSFKAASNPMKSAMDEVRKTTEDATRDVKDAKPGKKTPTGDKAQGTAQQAEPQPASTPQKTEAATKTAARPDGTDADQMPSAKPEAATKPRKKAVTKAAPKAEDNA